MVTNQDILEIAARLAAMYKPYRIVLFGSYATGNARPDSDVDILVIMPYEGNPIERAAEIIRSLNPPFALDLILRTENELRQRLMAGDHFLSEAVESGTELYTASNARVGGQSRRRLRQHAARA